MVYSLDRVVALLQPNYATQKKGYNGQSMNLIAATDLNWGIGKDGGLLTQLSGDLKYFKEKTSGKVVVMGRATLESLPNGKPLPNRTNIVLTSQPNFEKEGCIAVHSLDELRAECLKYDSDDVMIIGGEQIYMQMMKYCDRLFITKIFETYAADKHLMNVDKMRRFELASESDVKEENGVQYQFLKYVNTDTARF